MKKKYLCNSVLILAGLLIIACSGKQKSKHKDQLIEVKVDNNAGRKFESVFSAPSPEELMMLFEDANLNFNTQALSDPEMVSEYISSQSLAINLGVYITNAAYLNMFKQYSQMTGYLESIFIIVDKLELGGIYKEFDFKNLFKEMDNLDSLIVISEGMYHAVTGYMSDNDNEKQLCYISYGSIVELLYLTMNSIPEFNTNDPILQHVYDQQMQLVNLIEFSSQYSGDNEVDIMIANLSKIENVFDEVAHNDSETVLSETEDGVLKISGGVKQKFTKYHYDKLKTVIGEIRLQIINK